MNQRTQNLFTKYSVILVLILLLSGCVSPQSTNKENTETDFRIVNNPLYTSGGFTRPDNVIDMETMERINKAIDNGTFYIIQE